MVKNDGETYGSGGECGIGAVVPWAGKLWMITYSPHCPTGSTDKLYAIDERAERGDPPGERRRHARRPHDPPRAEQLIIGPYAIDKAGKVRVIPYSDDARPARRPSRGT